MGALEDRIAEDAERHYFLSLLGSLKDNIEKEIPTILKPFNRPEGAEYYGGRPGLDFADPLDITASAGATAYRAVDRLVRLPIVKGGMTIGDKLASRVGDPITSQEEAEAFMGRYDPEGSLEREGYDIKYWDYKDTGKGGNYFKPRATGAFETLSGMIGRTGVNIEPHKNLSGVEPITAAEEVGHGVRWAEGESRLIVDKGRLVDYLSRLSEETGAKTSALFDVAKNEGAIEALASIPSVASTWLSYALPSSKKYKLGEVEADTWYNPMTEGKKNWEIFDSHLIGRERGKSTMRNFDDWIYSHTGDEYLDPDTGEYFSEGDSFDEAIRKNIPEFKDATEFEITQAMMSAYEYENIMEAGPIGQITNWWDRRPGNY